MISAPNKINSIHSKLSKKGFKFNSVLGHLIEKKKLYDCKCIQIYEKINKQILWHRKQGTMMMMSFNETSYGICS